MLVKRSDKPTNYVLPALLNGYKFNWYYYSERDLYCAYRQLKALNGKIKPSFPVVY